MTGVDVSTQCADGALFASSDFVPRSIAEPAEGINPTLPSRTWGRAIRLNVLHDILGERGLHGVPI